MSGRDSGRLVVVGDVMLDVNREGSVSRVSPEGPVVILRNPGFDSVLGGAANTAANIHSLGGDVLLFGVVGDDPAGEECAKLLAEDGVEDGLVRASAYRTTVKTRFLARGQHIMRLDEEQSAVPQADLERLLELVTGALPSAGALVLSDYDKGVVTSQLARVLIDKAHVLGIPVIVDSKKLDMTVFEGATVVTPNEMEATRCTGVSDAAEAARIIASQTGGAVLVTRGALGMLLLEDGRETSIPAEGQEVADVVGAGDTVTAGIAVALVEGESGMAEAARWANRAAAVAVQHTGTYAVRRTDFE